jgi:hypothetical protein
LKLTIQDRPISLTIDGIKRPLKVEDKVINLSVSNGLRVVNISGGSGDSFVFTQPTPDTVWTVTHNLGRFPSVVVIDSAGDEWATEIHYINNNSLEVRLTAAFSGTAYCN